MTIKNILLASIVGILIIATASCRTNKRVARDQQANNRQRPNGQRPDGQRRTPAQMMAQMDANKDGRLSIKEAQGRLKNNFKTVDTNNNGFITLSELKAAPRPQRGPRGNRPNQMR